MLLQLMGNREIWFVSEQEQLSKLRTNEVIHREYFNTETSLNSYQKTLYNYTKTASLPFQTTTLARRKCHFDTTATNRQFDTRDLAAKKASPRFCDKTGDLKRISPLQESCQNHSFVLGNQRETEQSG